MKQFTSLALITCFLHTLLIGQHDSKIDSLVGIYYEDEKPGIAMTVVKDGQIIYSHEVGLAVIEHNIAISDSTLFQLASVSKQFTAYLTLKLEQEGKLKMDDDVRAHLPELESLPHQISLSQLANHTHGLPNVSELANIKGFGLSDRMSHRDMVNMALRIKTFNFKPGEQYEYNNTGFVLLAEIIERRAGMPFHEALRTYIFEPLGMTSSAAVYNPDIIVKNRAESYALANNTYKRYDSNSMSNGSGGIRTTINDFAKWAIHFQKTYHDINSPFARMIENSYLNDGRALPYGLGLETKNYRGSQAVFHGGGDAGYRAYTLHFPEHNLSIFILGNTNDYWPLELAYKVSDYLLSEEQIKPTAINKATNKNAELKTFEGSYEFCPGNYYVFTASHDTLFMEVFGQPGKVALPKLGEHSFGFPYYPKSKFVFENDKVDLKIADFTYACQKVEVKPQKYTSNELKKFTGFYRNESLNTTYEIILENDQLIARHPINYDIRLQGLENNSFFSNWGFFGKLDFKLNKHQEATMFSLSGQNIRRLAFKKINR